MKRIKLRLFVVVAVFVVWAVAGAAPLLANYYEAEEVLTLWGRFLATDFGNDFYRTFIRGNRYMLFLEGMGNTLLLSLLAILFGTIIGLVSSFFSLSKFKVLRAVSYVYLDIIRGTPIMVQILVFYFVIFPGRMLPTMLTAGLAFGVNSGAHISEIIRAGILSIDKGQTEAGRSLGMSGFQTMRLIVLPQAVKNILPALANEFITLIKLTAIAGAIAVFEITRAAQLVRSSTFISAMPLLGAAVMYYVIIKILSTIFRRMERWLRRSDVR